MRPSQRPLRSPSTTTMRQDPERASQTRELRPDSGRFAQRTLLESRRGVDVDSLDGLLGSPPAVLGRRGEVERVPRPDLINALVLEFHEEDTGDDVDELLAVVRVEALAPRVRRHPDVGGVHDLLARGHLLETYAVVPLHDRAVFAPHERGALLQVGPEELAHGHPVRFGQPPERGDRSPRPAPLERRDERDAETRGLRNLLERLVCPGAKPPEPFPHRVRRSPTTVLPRLLDRRTKLLAYGGEVKALDLPELLDRAQPLHVRLRVDSVTPIGTPRPHQTLPLPQPQGLRSQPDCLRDLAYGEPHRTSASRQSTLPSR